MVKIIMETEFQMFGDRLKLLREIKRLTQDKLANLTQTSKGNISNYESNNRKPGSEFLSSLSKTYPDININWLLTGEGSMFLAEPCQQLSDSSIELPLITVSCGGGYTQSDNAVVVIDKQPLVEAGFRSFDKFVACRAIGDSMYPYIEEDDLLVVNTLCDVVDGRVYVINVSGNLFCKKIRRGIKYFIMESINKAYPEEKFTTDELSSLNIIGQVITIIRKARI